jgi:putative DNA methylase
MSDERGTVKIPKKLIEVALPLDEINAAAKREKSIRHGHPSTLHLWWARRPLAAARAVLFAQLVNDPGYERELGRGVNKEAAEAERKRLFEIIKKLVLWENTTNEEVLAEAREEIWKSWRETCALNKKHPQAQELFDPDILPAFHDPFAGGGAIPLEAQRLGLEAWASDLNPVAVLINKAMIEIPPKFAGRPPMNPDARKQKRVASEWKGAAGLAADVRYYGQWMRDEAEKRIGHLYPKVRVTEEMAEERPDLREYVGEDLTVIAWLWARTIKCPNPACRGRAPLLRSFSLSKKKGREAYVEPEIDRAIPAVKQFKVRFDDTAGFDGNARFNGLLWFDGKILQSTTDSKGARCIFCATFIKKPELREIATKYGLEAIPVAVVAEGRKGRVYLSSDAITIPDIEKPAVPEVDRPMTNDRRWFSPPLYGLPNFSDIFTPRQLVALTTFSDLIGEARAQVLADALAAGMPDDGRGLEGGGDGATAYADAVAVYLAFAINRLAMTGCSLVRWNSVGEKAQHAFGRQALPMVWDYAEPNFLGKSTGCLDAAVFCEYDPLKELGEKATGFSLQSDASNQETSQNKIVSTDPPYYDNISYADLSDFFYVWLRRSLKPVLPSLFATIAVPKAEELVATAYRHGSKEAAEAFFMDGMTEAMRRLAEQAHPAFPVTIYYAFKQSETKGNDTTSPGWESFLEAVLKAGFAVTGTWPMRTEMKTRQVAMNANALASSIILVCRRRDLSAPPVSRREFLSELKATLPEALDEMTASSIAPVDLAQASIGPGMGVFSQYSAVLEADGTPMSVHDALVLINRELDAYFSNDSGDVDADTRFCLGWFEENGWKEGKFGDADVLARARGTTVDGVREAGVVEAGGGKVRLMKWSEYPEDWEPETDSRTPVWEALHHLVRVHQCDGGDAGAAALLARMPGRAAAIRQLAYRLYTLCERKGWAEDARPYNELITSWGAVEAQTPAMIEKTPQKTLSSYGG